LKHIFGTLNKSKSKTFQLHSFKLYREYNFGIDHVNIQGCLIILNFKMYELKTIFWDSNQIQIKILNYKVEDRVNVYNFDVKFVSSNFICTSYEIFFDATIFSDGLLKMSASVNRLFDF